MPHPYLQVLFALVLIIAGGYLFFDDAVQSPEVSEWQQTLPKTYLEGSRVSSYNEEGALTDVLEAASAVFYPSMKESVLTSPRLYSHNLRDDTWSVSSDSGLFNHKREMLTLNNNVVLINDTNKVQLSTETMYIDFRKNIASSKVPVLITHGESSTRAEGMVANLESQVVRLEPNVETIYVQPEP